MRSKFAIYAPITFGLIISCGQSGELAQNASLSQESIPQSNPPVIHQTVEMSQKSRQDFLKFYPDADIAQLTREYFVEMFLAKGEDKGLTPTKRLVNPPLIRIDPILVETPWGEYLREELADIVSEMTGGRLGVQHDEPLESGTMPVISFRISRERSSGSCTTEIDPVATGAPLSGGIIWCDGDYLDTVRSDYLQAILRHEMGHILSQTIHSGMINTIMSYNGISRSMPQFELDAWNLLYALPDATSWETLVANGHLGSKDLHPAPTISYAIPISLGLEEQNSPSDINPPKFLKNVASPGQRLKIVGNRHFFSWGCHSRAISYPVVTIADKQVIVEPVKLPSNEYDPQNPYGYFNPCPPLIIQVPESVGNGGSIRIKNRQGLMSNAVQLTITIPETEPAKFQDSSGM